MFIGQLPRMRQNIWSVNSGLVKSSYKYKTFLSVFSITGERYLFLVIFLVVSVVVFNKKRNNNVTITEDYFNKSLTPGKPFVYVISNYLLFLHEIMGYSKATVTKKYPENRSRLSHLLIPFIYCQPL